MKMGYELPLLPFLVLASPFAWAQAQSIEAQKLLDRGACVACHGAGLNTPTDLATPKLAGQHGDFLLAAMRAYRRSNGTVTGREHPAMNSVMALYSAKELEIMARYIEKLPGSLSTVGQGGIR